MATRPRGRGPEPTSQNTTHDRTHDGGSCDGELAHDGTLTTSALRRAGDGELHRDVPLRFRLTRRGYNDEHSVLGTKHVNPGDDRYLLAELARYLRRDLAGLRRLAKQLGLLRRLPHDCRHRALSRAQAKALIQAVRAR